MAKKTTAVAFETEDELLELKADALEAGTDVSKYIRGLAKEKRELGKITGNAIKSGLIKEQSTLNEVKLSEVNTLTKEEMEDIAEKAAVRVRNMDKLHEKIDKVYEKQCQGEECIQGLKKEIESMKQKYDCPTCKSHVLRDGDKFCPECGEKIKWRD